MKAAKSLIMVLALWMAASCAGKSTEQSDNQNIVAQVSIIFDADSAYSFVAQQCAFGRNRPCGNREALIYVVRAVCIAAQHKCVAFVAFERGLKGLKRLNKKI